MDEAPHPIDIRRLSTRDIEITWSDGGIQRYSVGTLRKACPCATCREKRRAAAEELSEKPKLPVLSSAEARPLTITHMKPVGNYAYNIGFSDGHDSGIFQFAFLRELGVPSQTPQ